MKNTLVRCSALVLTAVAVLSLSSCALFRPYRIQIQQGNVITPKMIDNLKPGMTENQVEYVLGTPDIQDPLHPHTWYYVYTNEENYQPRAERQLIVHFDATGHLQTIEGDYVPPAPLQPEPVVSAS